jgi:hypothetical protein
MFVVDDFWYQHQLEGAGPAPLYILCPLLASIVDQCCHLALCLWMPLSQPGLSYLINGDAAEPGAVAVGGAVGVALVPILQHSLLSLMLFANKLECWGRIHDTRFSS